MFEDEVSFWLDGTLHQSWARVGKQSRVDTFGQRKTAHVFGAVSLEKRPRFRWLFADVFNGETFLCFLKHLVAKSRRKIFLVITNSPIHQFTNLKPDGKDWLAANKHRIELHRLPLCFVAVKVKLGAGTPGRDVVEEGLAPGDEIATQHPFEVAGEADENTDSLESRASQQEGSL